MKGSDSSPLPEPQRGKKTDFRDRRGPLGSSLEFRLQAAGRWNHRVGREFSISPGLPTPCRLKAELHTRMRPDVNDASSGGQCAIPCGTRQMFWGISPPE